MLIPPVWPAGCPTRPAKSVRSRQSPGPRIVDVDVVVGGKRLDMFGGYHIYIYIYIHIYIYIYLLVYYIYICRVQYTIQYTMFMMAFGIYSCNCNRYSHGFSQCDMVIWFGFY